jgi:hypothetical protein
MSLSSSAFSTSFSPLRSKGEMRSVLASGTDTDATCLRGVGTP